MKKIVCLALAAIMLVSVFAFTSCTANEKPIKVIDIKLTDEQYAYAVKKGDSELLASLNAFLAEIKENGKFSVDLKGLNKLRLEQAGLNPDNIAISSECTGCDENKYWSHRKLGNNRGSMAAAIQLL